MKIAYIAPSTLPSRAANAAHVVMQCEALGQAGAEVTLFARRSVQGEQALPGLLGEAYGVALRNCGLVTLFTQSDRATSLRVALMALRHLLRREAGQGAVVLSRNLYASFILGVVFRRPMLFETHQLESGWRKLVQRLIMTRPWVATIVISEKLAECLKEHHGVAPSKTIVLHDAAPEGPEPLPPQERREALLKAFPELQGDWRAVCGYFGHLYPGRGIEIIHDMAAARPDSLFVVFGGNESDIARCKAASALANLRFMGHISHAKARDAMRRMDVLLMPYQESVSIGAKGQDTAKWMSPMKMFEYMASGAPVISSDLPVLREVLRDGENALLVAPADGARWIAALDRLTGDPEKANALARQAYADFKANHTWSGRAARIIEAARGL